MWVEIHTPHAESDGFSIQREVVSDTVEIHTPRAESDVDACLLSHLRPR